MGNNPLQLSFQDSVAEPGSKSIISAEIPISFEDFCDKALETAKYPIFDPVMENSIKEVQVEDAGPDELHVKVILDGARVAANPELQVKDPTGQSRDFVCSHVKTKCKRAERMFLQDEYTPYFVGDEEGKFNATSKTIFHNNPFRLEYWKVSHDGSRWVDDSALAGLQFFVGVMMGDLKDKPVEIKLDEDGRAFTTGPIDESIVTYDKLFDGVLAALKEFPSPTIEEISLTKTKLTYGANPDENDYNFLVHDKEEGTIVFTGWNPEGTKKKHSMSFTFTQSPLELTVVPVGLGGKPLLGKVSMRGIQFMVERAVSNAGSTSAWMGGFF